MPAGTSASRQKLRTSSMAPVSNTIASATSTITSADLIDCRDGVDAARASFKAPRTSGFENCHAGTMPNRMPVTPETAAAKNRTRPSNATSVSRGRPAGANARIRSRVHTASSRPARPPAHATMKLSIRSKRARRTRPAPSARRMPSSRYRPAERASIRPAMFAQAMSRTTATAARIITSGVRVCPTRSSCSPVMRGVQPALSG